MNKKKLSLLLLVAALLTSFSAQAKTGFGIGPKVGVSISKLSLTGDDVIKKNFDSDNRAGFTVGLQAEYIAPVLGIGADISLMYMYQSTKVEDEKVSGNFFEIPLHAKYQISLPAVESIVAPYIYTGPSVAFKLGGKDSYGHTKSTQWGWDLGVGLTLIKHLQIGAGYTFGINNIAKKFDFVENAANDIKLKNNYWTVTAAWMF